METPGSPVELGEERVGGGGGSRVWRGQGGARKTQSSDTGCGTCSSAVCWLLLCGDGGKAFRRPQGSKVQTSRKRLPARLGRMQDGAHRVPAPPKRAAERAKADKTVWTCQGLRKDMLGQNGGWIWGRR